MYQVATTETLVARVQDIDGKMLVLTFLLVILETDGPSEDATCVDTKWYIHKHGTNTVDICQCNLRQG